MIRNKTTGKVISARERVCTSRLSQAWGLMFRRKQNLVMVFPEERRVSLHMFFVFYPIEVLVVDAQDGAKGKIVEIKRDFRPFTFWSSAKKGKYVVELAWPGKYEVGNIIELQLFS